jgi:hypothetical protein
VRRDRTSAAEAGSSFFPEAADQNPPAGGNLNTNANTSTATGHSADNNVAPLPDPALPALRPDGQGVRNLEEIRRSMAEQQAQRAQDANRGYGRELDNDPRSDRYAYERNGDRAYRYDDMPPPPPRRYYGPPPRYEYLPPPMPPPRYYGPPPNDDRAPYYPDPPSDNRGFPDDPR